MIKLDRLGINNAKPAIQNSKPVRADDYNKVVEKINEIIDVRPSKAYYSFITQTGTTAPTATVIVDTLPYPTWGYTNVGIFTLTKTNAFTSGKTYPFKSAYTDIDGNKITAEWTDVNTITVKTYAAVDTTVLANGVLTNQEFNVEIYN